MMTDDDARKRYVRTHAQAGRTAWRLLVAARRAPICMGGWEYLVQTDESERVWVSDVNMQKSRDPSVISDQPRSWARG